MNNYSQAEREIKKLLDDMARNDSTFASTEDLMKTIGGIIDKYGESEDWEIGVADEATVCIPLSRYDELLRSESEIDILCTLVESPYVAGKTALAALESVADMRDKRLNDCEDDDLPCEESGSRRCSPMASGTDAAWRHRWIC